MQCEGAWGLSKPEFNINSLSRCITVFKPWTNQIYWICFLHSDLGMLCLLLDLCSGTTGYNLSRIWNSICHLVAFMLISHDSKNHWGCSVICTASLYNPNVSLHQGDKTVISIKQSFKIHLSPNLSPFSSVSPKWGPHDASSQHLPYPTSQVLIHIFSPSYSLPALESFHI